MEGIKRIRDSLTVWFNGVLAVLAGLLLGMPDLFATLAATLPGLMGLLPAGLAGPLLLIAVVGNIVIRVFLTSKPLTAIAAR